MIDRGRGQSAPRSQRIIHLLMSRRDNRMGHEPGKAKQQKRRRNGARHSQNERT